MARTRGASGAYDVQIDRQGNAISPAAAHLARVGKISGGTVLHGTGAEPTAAPPAIVGYRAEPRSWSRNMEAYELALLLHMLMPKGFVVDVTPEQFATLSGDVRRHFMPVRETKAHAA